MIGKLWLIRGENAWKVCWSCHGAPVTEGYSSEETELIGFPA